eukprot:m.138297 g.138297  ORF g.138297 m.138297 type:complete len:290 (+) comp9955_c0_seq1:284-1153(+)
MRKTRRSKAAAATDEGSAAEPTPQTPPASQHTVFESSDDEAEAAEPAVEAEVEKEDTSAQPSPTSSILPAAASPVTPEDPPTPAPSATQESKGRGKYSPIRRRNEKDLEYDVEGTLEHIETINKKGHPINYARGEGSCRFVCRDLECFWDDAGMTADLDDADFFIHAKRQFFAFFGKYPGKVYKIDLKNVQDFPIAQLDDRLTFVTRDHVINFCSVSHPAKRRRPNPTPSARAPISTGDQILVSRSELNKIAFGMQCVLSCVPDSVSQETRKVLETLNALQYELAKLAE